jgi:hypothetical protein
VSNLSFYITQIDEDELEDARWFRRPELVQMLTRQHPEGIFVPPEQAIAHQIIKSWVRKTTNSYLILEKDKSYFVKRTLLFKNKSSRLISSKCIILCEKSILQVNFFIID